MKMDNLQSRFNASSLEQKDLLVYLLKWTYFGITTGIIAGMGVVIFLKLLAWAIAVWTQEPGYYFFIPIALLLNSLLVCWLAPGVSGGSDKVIEAIHRRAGGYLPLSEVPVKMIATVITIASGGSAGKEGPGLRLEPHLVRPGGDS